MSNAFFCGPYKEISLQSAPKLINLGITERNLNWLCLKITLSEQLNKFGVVDRSPTGNIFTAGTNRYQFALQNAGKFPKRALEFEGIVHKQLSLLHNSERELIRSELALIQNSGINTSSQGLLRLLGGLDFGDFSINDFCDHL
jgi:hypothetical protein